MGKDEKDLLSVLRIQCANGACHDVSFDVAMMSPRLKGIIQDIRRKGKLRAHSSPSIVQHIHLGDLPSKGVEHALDYLRCVYLQRVEGRQDAVRDWRNTVFSNFDSRVLCELASASYHLDLQNLVDLTCRSIAEMMAKSENAKEVREKFGCVHCTRLDCPGSCDETDDHSTIITSCESFDLGSLVFEGILEDEDDDDDNDDDDDEDDEDDEEEEEEEEGEEEERDNYDDRNLDDLIGYINGTTSTSSSNPRKGSSAKKKRSARKKRKRKNNRKGLDEQHHQQQQQQQQHNSGEVGVVSASKEPVHCTAVDSTSDRRRKDGARGERKNVRLNTLAEKVRAASIDPSIVFDESKFEDDGTRDVDLEVESFRHNLEQVHKEYAARPKIALRVPLDVTHIRRINQPCKSSSM